MQIEVSLKNAGNKKRVWMAGEYGSLRRRRQWDLIYLHGECRKIWLEENIREEKQWKKFCMMGKSIDRNVRPENLLYALYEWKRIVAFVIHVW